MENNITLTIDEIHAIREEHYQKTNHLCFDEYKRLLDAEIALVLLSLSRIKEAFKKGTTVSNANIHI